MTIIWCNIVSYSVLCGLLSNSDCMIHGFDIIYRERERDILYIYIHICTHACVCVHLQEIDVMRLKLFICVQAWVFPVQLCVVDGSCFSGRKWHGFVGTCAWKRNHHIPSFTICSTPACQVDFMHHIPLMNVALRTGKCPGNRRSFAVQQLLEAAERYQ